MLGGLMTRGTHATGISLQQPDGSIFTLKNDVNAMKLMAGEEWEPFLDKYLPEARICLLHTRLATQGDPKDNQNNHPLTQGVSAVVHNGVIGNDGELFTRLGLERKAEVDSDIIRAILDAHGLSKTALAVLEGMTGGAAIAAISAAEPGRLLLARSGNPIVKAMRGNTFMWASEKRFLHACARPYFEWKGMWFQNNQANCA